LDHKGPSKLDTDGDNLYSFEELTTFWMSSKGLNFFFF